MRFLEMRKGRKKKIRGKLHYFGPGADPVAAEHKYLDEKEYLQAPQASGKARLCLRSEAYILRQLVGDSAAMTLDRFNSSFPLQSVENLLALVVIQ